MLAAMLLIAMAVVPFGYLLRRPVEVPVAGTITLDGVPLSYANVSFFNLDGYRGGCDTDVGGTFSVYLLPGSYQVAVTKMDADRFGFIGPTELYLQMVAKQEKLCEQVNARYGDWSKSGLMADVRSDKRNNLVFALTTPPIVVVP